MPRRDEVGGGFIIDRKELVSKLESYIIREILNGDETGLHEHSPLLEWGLLNSLESLRLLAFIDEQFGVTLAGNMMTPQSLATIGSIADLIMQSTGDSSEP
jgi:acyl carrier protein